jgi:2,5-furandicarboxylate decarboxylase 1
MEPIHDLHNYLAVLEDSGQLTRIEKPVNLVHELANVAAEVARQGRGGAYFSQPQNSEWPVFAGAVATQQLASLALGCDMGQVSDTMGRVLEPTNGIPPRRVNDATWKANVITGDDIDLGKIPIPTHGKNDGGP